MIKLSLQNKNKLFNLNDFETEKRLVAAWKSMRDDKKFVNKRFNITTDTGEKLSLVIGEIVDCIFDDCEYIKAEVHTKKEEPKKEEPKQAPPKDPYDIFMDKINKNQKDQERENLEKFFGIVRGANIIVDPNDPNLLQILDHVKKVGGHDTFKIKMFANLYINTKKASKR